MRTIVMTVSALFLGICGVVISFLPQEIFSYLGENSETYPVLFLQLLGALYLGMAIINWMSRKNLIGGIYNRPLALTNMMHYAIGASVLLKFIFRDEPPAHLLIIIATVIYTSFALAFITIMFTTPKLVERSN